MALSSYDLRCWAKHDSIKLGEFVKKQAVPDAEASYRVLTIRGITSAVIANELVHDESTAEICRVLRTSMSATYRTQVQHVSIDSPSKAL